MENVFFDPWVGKNYSDEDNYPRILVLGESHQCGDVGNNNRCKKDSQGQKFCGDTSWQCPYGGPAAVMRDFISDVRKDIKSYNKFTKAVCNALTINDKNVFWDRVVFYDYVQRAIEKGKSPTKDDWKQGADSFFNVLKKYQPDMIIVWGKRLWDNMPSEDVYSNWGRKDWKNQGTWNTTKSKSIYTYHLTDDDGKIVKKIPAFWLFHPASRTFYRAPYLHRNKDNYPFDSILVKAIFK
jgi:hypothetical protein